MTRRKENADRHQPETATGAASESLADVMDSRDWLRVTLGSIGDAVITTDVNGRCTFLNPVAERLTGWTSHEAITCGEGGKGAPLLQVFHIVNQETREVVENPALRALREGVIVGLANQTILISRDGTERPIDDSAAPIRAASGDVRGAVLVFRDISERHRQEQLVKAALDYAVSILETQRVPFLVLDSELRVVSGNRAFYDTFAVNQQETEGQLVYELGNRQWNIPKLRELLEDILPRSSLFDGFEVSHHFESIGPRTMLLNARRIRKPGNHSQLILLAIEDITQRRRLEEDLHDSEVRYRRLFQTAKDGVLILDGHSGQIIDSNVFIQGLLGLEHGEILGKELHEIGMFQDTTESKEAFRRLQREKYLRYEHLPLQNQRGEEVAVEVVANMYHEDHRLVAQCNVRDITERVRLQERLAEQAERIAHESRRKDEFLAMLSHELRNPLAPIRSAVHLMRTRERGSEDLISQQAREIIERQVATLTKLVSDLLEVSRVVSGRIRLNQQIVDMKQVVHHAIQTITPIIEQRKHALVVHECPDPVWITVDPTRMEEVFINLLTNAAKYTPDGGRIDVWCEHPTGSNYSQVRIRDNGMGIDKEMLPLIFDLFTQADRSLARSARGLGNVLSLAHRLVDMHGGRIEAQSPPRDDPSAGGSEFIVTLATTSAPELAAALPTETPEPSVGIRVLVVDDNIDQTMMLAAALRHQGYSVQAAYTGPDENGSAVEARHHPLGHRPAGPGRLRGGPAHPLRARAGLAESQIDRSHRLRPRNRHRPGPRSRLRRAPGEALRVQ